MSFSTTVSLEDLASPFLRRTIAGLAPARLNPVLGRSARSTIRDHLFGLNSTRPNRLGGRRTQFYAQAARGTQYQVVGDNVVVSINQVGIRQRYYGGTIRPVSRKYLAIPARTEAYGKSPREFSDLVFIKFASGSAALVRLRGRTRQRIDAAGNVTGGERETSEVMYWLVTSVTQQPDPTVLPYRELIVARLERDAAAYVQLLYSRGGGQN